MDVILVHDAAIDEFMSQVLLTTIPNVNLLGAVIVNADCIDSVAMQVGDRINQYIGAQSMPLALSRARGWNPFPWQYRTDCIRLSAISALNGIPAPAYWPPYPDGDVLFEELLDQAKPGVTVLLTCPFTPLSELLQMRPDLEAKIGQLIWMGGAINVGGNLDPNTISTPPGNACAEWNAFWDPASVDWIFRNTSFPIIQFPLDITNQAAITKPFMATLAAQSAAGAKFSTLAYQSYELVSAESFYDMWDVCATAWLAQGENNFFVPPTPMKLAIDAELNASQGCITSNADGREVQVVFNFADGGQQRFYDYVAKQFNRS